MKKCKSCLQEKHKSEFHKTTKSKDGFRGQCKQCLNAKGRYRRAKAARPEVSEKNRLKTPSQEYLLDNFEYHNSGNLACKKPRGNLKVGDFLAKNSNMEYKRCSVMNAIYLLHRLIYKYHTGLDPENIDHINGDKRDNRIENLRPCTYSENKMNSRRSDAPLKANRVAIKSGSNGSFYVTAVSSNTGYRRVFSSYLAAVVQANHIMSIANADFYGRMIRENEEILRDSMLI